MDANDPGGLPRDTLAGALVAFVGGLVASAAHLPLPWLLGPLLAVAALHLSGRTAPVPTALRSAGQLVVGAAVGVAFVPTVAALALAFWPLVVANAVAMLLCGVAGGWLLHRFTRVDLRTCYLSAAIAGASDMQALAERFGADTNVVASAQVLRIAIVVIVVPLALTCVAGDHATGTALVDLRSSSPSGLAALLAIAGAAGWIARRVRVPNAWGIAPLLASCVCAAAGLSLGNIPPALVHTGQLTIGWALGSRFSAGFFRAQPRFLFAVSAYTVAILVASVVLGCILGQWAEGDSYSVILGAAPGGVAEMSMTARQLDLDVSLVTSLQLARVVAGALLTAPLLLALQRTVTASAAARDGRVG